MPEHDRDQSVDRLLKQTLSGGAIASTPGACVDGETLAAWTAGTLRTAEAAAVEQHLADCDRCQAMLATFVRATPAQPAPEPLWRRWRLPWLVPLATAATAVALWVAAPANRPEVANPQSDEAVATATRLETPTAPSVQAPPEAPTAPVGNTAANELSDRRTLQAPVPQAPAESSGQFARAERGNRAADEAPSAGRQSLEVLAPPAPAASPEGNIRADARAKLAEADADGKKEVASPARALSAARQVAAVEIVAPGGATRWRVTGGSQLERSTSSGSWEPVTLPSPAVLTAGSAASPSVCWIVGRAGAVFVTTDGVRFVRVSFPEAVDLVAVSAIDGRGATVTAADGRSWRTTDQGRTWAAPPG